MNPDDMSNLKFLLSADTQTLEDWYSVITEDEINYARTLLEVFHLDLIEEIVDRSGNDDATNLLSHIMEKK